MKDKPAHYTNGPIEPIEYIAAMGDAEAFCRGNVIKYVHRYQTKQDQAQRLADLNKALNYLTKLIELEEIY